MMRRLLFVLVAGLTTAAHAGDKHDIRGITTGMPYVDALAVAKAGGANCTEIAPLVAECLFENRGRLTLKATAHLTSAKVFFVDYAFHLASRSELPQVMRRFDASFHGRCVTERFDDPNNCDLQRVDESIAQEDSDADLARRR